ESAMDQRVQGLDPPVHDLGKGGHGRDVGDLDTFRTQERRGAARGEQADVARAKRASEVHETFLARHAQQRPTYGYGQVASPAATIVRLRQSRRARTDSAGIALSRRCRSS